MKALVLAVILLLVLPLNAAGENPTPYIEIQQPEDGSVVGTETILVVYAEGEGLKNPSFSISGENAGIAGPLAGCIFETQEMENATDGITGMYCKQKIDISGFEGQKVEIGVSVDTYTGTVRDIVGVYVSGEAFRGLEDSTV